MIQWIKNLIFGKEKLKYPNDFFIVDYSPLAQEYGFKDNKNKLIFRYFMNNYGNIELKKYRYSEERVMALNEIHKIPGYDKTKKEVRFPVFSRILPGEVRFTEEK